VNAPGRQFAMKVESSVVFFDVVDRVGQLLLRTFSEREATIYKHELDYHAAACCAILRRELTLT
jgi:hypothetical protein